MVVDVRPTSLAPDDDPYLWLEEIEGEAALAWIDQQNARTLAAFGGDKWRADSAQLTELFDRPDRIPGIRRRGKLLQLVEELSLRTRRVLPLVRQLEEYAQRMRTLRDGMLSSTAKSITRISEPCSAANYAD